MVQNKFVSPATIQAMFDIITECYKMNRYLDRFVSVLNVKFACNESSDLIHHGISHWYPIFADKLGERCLERYNISVEYGATPAATQDWESVTDMMNELEDKVGDFSNMLDKVQLIGEENEDTKVADDLMILVTYHSYIVEQTILLNDKIRLYTEANLASFDAHIRTHFWILGHGKEGDDD